MQDKLQQLTQKLYDEGLAKGKEEAQAMLKEAQEESEKILSAARQQSGEMIAKAQSECLELKSKAEGDIKTAARQALSQIKQDIEKSVTMETVNIPVKEALSSKDFMQSLIMTVVSAFKPENEASSLDIILPQSKKEELDGFIRDEVGKTFSKGLNVAFSKDITNGFKVSQKGSGYFIDLTEDSFCSIIAEYLRPKTRKLIFGE